MGQHHIQLFTFRKGVAARLGHDLRLSVEHLSLSYADGAVRVSIAAGDLRVDGAVKGGKLDPRGLDEDDRGDILETMRTEVLHTVDHPTIVYEGTVSTHGERVDVDGRLTLHGRTVALPLSLQRRGPRLAGEVTVVPSRWGIPPYKALGGTLRVDDRVTVTIDMALDAAAAWPPVTLG